ncbi:ATP-binding protein [Actinocorallia longicatena]|uniref:Histidine kinase/HSP90-like ATPase domain-containing protein n=1 Tax=Actinocorallia longicatena TaxID=111803 RepID=A0ABP6Q573_9ACTN
MPSSMVLLEEEPSTSPPTRMVWQATLPGDARQVGAARRIVEALFAGTGREDDAGLIASELVTNALRHSRSGLADGWFDIQVLVPDLGEALIVVTDLGCEGRPSFDARESDGEPAEGGMGLRIVRDLAERFEYHGTPGHGHRIGVYLGLRTRAAE